MPPDFLSPPVWRSSSRWPSFCFQCCARTRKPGACAVGLAALDDLADELEPSDLAQRRQRLETSLDDHGGKSTSPGVLLGLLIVVPVATFLLYRAVGEPQGLDQSDSQVTQIRAVLIDLANSLERNPDDIDNWVRLGLSYKDLREFSSAEHALRRALYLDEGQCVHSGRVGRNPAVRLRQPRIAGRSGQPARTGRG